jgi:hypothetical protein
MDRLLRVSSLDPRDSDSMNSTTHVSFEITDEAKNAGLRTPNLLEEVINTQS